MGSTQAITSLEAKKRDGRLQICAGFDRRSHRLGVLGQRYRGDGAPAALPECQHASPRAALVLGEAPVLAVGRPVLRLDVAADVGAVDLDDTLERQR
jgi:hypothetical protein